MSDVRLLHLPDSTVIAPDLPTDKYYVGYRFNALGCRGRDYAIPKPEGTLRIVVLGGSYTLGFGVHEEDTFTYQLEPLLNAHADAVDAGLTYEVINCGLGGYGTRQERLFYQHFASKYEPDIILLVMVANDNFSSSEEEELGYTYRPGPAASLFRSWFMIQSYRHSAPLDFSNSLQETLQLHRDVQKQGSALAVVFFRNNSTYTHWYVKQVMHWSWEHLVDTITHGLEKTDIPILDLGEALFRNHSDKELFVHERLDWHPNEIAHGIAAEEILHFLKTSDLLESE